MEKEGEIEIMYTTNCPTCNGEMKSKGSSVTLVGYINSPGHDHDDNCHKRKYICIQCRFILNISKQNKCSNPECDWVGKEECFCHEGKKVKNWPEPYINTGG